MVDRCRAEKRWVATEMRGAINHDVKRFRSLAVALKELERFVRDGRHLMTGRPFRSMGGMRSREALANWLLCVAINAAEGRDLTFCSDPTGGDGIIQDAATGEVWPTEHVVARAPNVPADADLGDLVLAAIERKRAKGGAAYAAGKALVVFVEGAGGAWFPNRVARRLPDPLHFAAVWAVGLRGVEEGRYVYSVAALDAGAGDAPVMVVAIAEGFDGWTVERIQ